MKPGTITRGVLLRLCGTVLYGPSYKSWLLRTLKVNPRTLRRWEADEVDVPLSVFQELVPEMRGQIAMVAWAVMELELLGVMPRFEPKPKPKPRKKKGG
jgi:hypothetical protein